MASELTLAVMRAYDELEPRFHHRARWSMSRGTALTLANDLEVVQRERVVAMIEIGERVQVLGLPVEVLDKARMVRLIIEPDATTKRYEPWRLPEVREIIRTET